MPRLGRPPGKSATRGVCRHCGHERHIHARELCDACYKRYRHLYIPQDEAPARAAPPTRYCAYCGKEITAPGRRKFCCTACSQAYYREQESETRSTVPPANIREIQKSTRKVRTCLGCGKKFMSAGAWNRMCPSCAGKDDGGHPREASGEYHWRDAF